MGLRPRVRGALLQTFFVSQLRYPVTLSGLLSQRFHGNDYTHTCKDRPKKLSNSENCEHLKIFRKVDCVLSNHNEVQHTQANLKTKNLLSLLFDFFLSTQ